MKKKYAKDKLEERVKLVIIILFILPFLD